MTRKEHFIKRANLLAQIDTANKLGCKNVLKCAREELAKLEKKFWNEHFSNPLFSYMVTIEEADKLIQNGVDPTFKVRVTFKSGEVHDLMYYHEIAPGAKHSAIAKWAENILARKIQHPENIKSSRFIMG